MLYQLSIEANSYSFWTYFVLYVCSCNLSACSSGANMFTYTLCRTRYWKFEKCMMLFWVNFHCVMDIGRSMQIMRHALVLWTNLWRSMNGLFSGSHTRWTFGCTIACLPYPCMEIQRPLEGNSCTYICSVISPCWFPVSQGFGDFCRSLTFFQCACNSDFSHNGERFDGNALEMHFSCANLLTLGCWMSSCLILF